MKKLLAVVLSAIVLAGCSTSSRTTETTDDNGTDEVTLDGTTAVFDEATNKYLIEDGATLRFGTDDDNYGAAIVALWDETYPEHAGAVEYINNGAAGAADLLAEQQGEYPDVFFAIDGEVPRNEAHLLAFDEHLASKVQSNSIDTFYNSANRNNQTVYAPMTYDGMAFIWNKTMLETLGLDTTDADGDNLADAFDTWEEIFALAQDWQTDRPVYKDKNLNVVFPMTLENQWSDYHHLTSMGWEIFKDNDPLNPGYDDPKLAEGMQFILDAKEAKISVEESGIVTPAESMIWRWDDVLNNELSPFGLVGTWMDVEAAQETTGSEFVISALPTYKGNNQTPFVKTKGYVISAYTQYRSAANALVDLLYSDAGFQAMVDNSSYAPSLVDNTTIAPDMEDDGVQASFSNGFKYNYPEPQLTLPNAPAVKAMDVYYSFISDAEKAVYSGDSSIEDAITKLVSDSDAWYEANNVE